MELKFVSLENDSLTFGQSVVFDIGWFEVDHESTPNIDKALEIFRVS